MTEKNCIEIRDHLFQDLLEYKRKYHCIYCDRQCTLDNFDIFAHCQCKTYILCGYDKCYMDRGGTILHCPRGNLCVPMPIKIDLDADSNN